MKNIIIVFFYNRETFIRPIICKKIGESSIIFWAFYSVLMNINICLFLQFFCFVGTIYNLFVSLLSYTFKFYNNLNLYGIFFLFLFLLLFFVLVEIQITSLFHHRELY